MRVTVIATGLDDARVRRSPDLEQPSDSHGNVTPLRPESSGGSSHVETLTPAASLDSQPAQGEFREASPSQTPLNQEPEGEHGADWVSPFDDELDIPTFLRRSAD
jgi:hypothetical protein